MFHFILLHLPSGLLWYKLYSTQTWFLYNLHWYFKNTVNTNSTYISLYGKLKTVPIKCLSWCKTLVYHTVELYMRWLRYLRLQYYKWSTCSPLLTSQTDHFFDWLHYYLNQITMFKISLTEMTRAFRCFKSK